MIITEINKNELISSMRKTLGLPSNLPEIDDVLIAACIRRIAGFLCPCSAITIISSILKAFKYLVADGNEFKYKVENVLERLIIGGDLLELSEISTNDLEVKSTWLFAAHPSFLVRPSGSILIFGIVPDENTPVASLANRIKYQGCKRFLMQANSEDLASTLKDLGLTVVSESSWLKLPKVTNARDYLDAMKKKLSAASISSEINELMILNTDAKTAYYRGRWTTPGNLSGYFVAKRPHLYGINIWSYVELHDGKLQRFVDIPFKVNGITQRGCDGAWHLQMAVDHCRGNPQEFGVRSHPEGEIIDFYSPIPVWAERRLIAIGQTIEPQGSLFSYLIPKEDFLTEEAFLKEYLWLTRK